MMMRTRSLKQKGRMGDSDNELEVKGLCLDG